MWSKIEGVSSLALTRPVVIFRGGGWVGGGGLLVIRESNRNFREGNRWATDAFVRATEEHPKRSWEQPKSLLPLHSLVRSVRRLLVVLRYKMFVCKNMNFSCCNCHESVLCPPPPPKKKKQKTIRFSFFRSFRWFGVNYLVVETLRRLEN